MGTAVAIISVLLALITAGCIAYIAWELTSEKNHPSEVEDEPPQDEP